MSAPHAFYRKRLALQLPIVAGVDWRKVLNRLHEGAVDKIELDGIKDEVRKVGDACAVGWFTYLGRIRIDLTTRL